MTMMHAADSPATPSATSPRWTLVYWVATAFVAGSAAVAGAMDLMRLQPLFGILLHLGFPAYFATLLGGWKLLGALALMAPRLPLLKEWAYAGLFFDLSAAVVAHAAMGDAGVAQVGPIVSLAALFASWRLRPRSRRLVEVCARGRDVSGRELDSADG